jgi:hypothetical protein
MVELILTLPNENIAQLKIKAQLDENKYQKGKNSLAKNCQVSDQTSLIFMGTRITRFHLEMV